MLYGLLIIGLFLGFTLTKVILGRRMHHHHKPDDEELLYALAQERNCSIYDIFNAAGKAWSCSATKIDQDFDIYLDTMDIPAYVRHFMRQQPPSEETVRQDRPRMPVMPIHRAHRVGTEIPM